MVRGGASRTTGDAAQRRAPPRTPVEPPRSAAPAGIGGTRRHLRRFRIVRPVRRRRRSRFSSRDHAAESGLWAIATDGSDRPHTGSNGKRRSRHGPRPDVRHHRRDSHTAHVHQVGVGGGGRARGRAGHITGAWAAGSDEIRIGLIGAGGGGAVQTRSSRRRASAWWRWPSCSPIGLPTRARPGGQGRRGRDRPERSRVHRTRRHKSVLRASAPSSWRRRRGSVEHLKASRASNLSHRSRSRSTGQASRRASRSSTSPRRSCSWAAACSSTTSRAISTMALRRRHRRHRRRAAYWNQGALWNRGRKPGGPYQWQLRNWYALRVAVRRSHRRAARAQHRRRQLGDEGPSGARDRHRRP